MVQCSDYIMVLCNAELDQMTTLWSYVMQSWTRSFLNSNFMLLLYDAFQFIPFVSFSFCCPLGVVFGYSDVMQSWSRWSSPRTSQC